MHQNEIAIHPAFSDKQGQCLAFIHAYTVVLGRPPAEADLQRHFRKAPPSVHQVVLALERGGLITRTSGAARSIRLRVDPDMLSTLKAAQDQTVESPVQRHKDGRPRRLVEKSDGWSGYLGLVNILAGRPRRRVAGRASPGSGAFRNRSIST